MGRPASLLAPNFRPSDHSHHIKLSDLLGWTFSLAGWLAGRPVQSASNQHNDIVRPARWPLPVSAYFRPGPAQATWPNVN